MSISKIIDDGLQGATLGGIIGGALATALGGTAVCLTGPVGLVALAATAAVSATTGTAIGTAIGGTGGVVLGTIEEINKN